jgi:type I restriction enzyme S subunit
MELKPGNKQTEVGVIPEDWEVRTLQDLCKEEITYGIVQCGPHVSGGIPYIRVSDMDGPILDKEKMLCTSGEIASKFRRSEVRLGDIVYALRGRLGDVRAITLELEGANLTQGTARISPALCVHGPYLLWALRNPDVVLRTCAESKGTTFMEITLSDLRKIKIVVPSRAEQLKISSTLSDIDDHLMTLDLELTKKRNIKQAAMQELLTGKRRLPGFEGEWVVKRLREIGKCYRGVSYKGDADLKPHDTANTIRLLRSNNVQDSFVKISELKHVYNKRVATHQILTRDDIIICMANGSKALVGKAGRFQVNDGYKYTFGAFMGCFRTNPEKADPGFTFYLLQTDRYQRLIGDLLAGSSINNLKPSSIESLEFLFPERAEQLAIATVLSDIDAELTSLQNRRDSIQEVKQGMMQQLLTGKIRLT